MNRAYSFFDKASRAQALTPNYVKTESSQLTATEAMLSSFDLNVVGINEQTDEENGSYILGYN